jgi:L-lactate dehydrogenase complex protein LldG
MTPDQEQPIGVPKEEFLDSVRHALGRGPTPGPAPECPQLKETVAELEARAREAERRNSKDRKALASRFLETAKLRGWKVHRASNAEGALVCLSSIVTSLNVDRAVRSDQEVFQGLPLDPALAGLGISVTTIARDEEHTREVLREEIVAAGVGITGADYAVAETGSVVVLPRKGLSRLVSLVPPVHIAVVRAQEIVESLDDIFLLRRLHYHRNGGDMGSYLNFISGPSRTADIEQTLVVGVHGPKEVHLVLLG